MRRTRDGSGRPLWLLGVSAGEAPAPSPPDWRAADPSWIQAALERVRRRSGGGWYVIGASRAFGRRPTGLVVAGHELVVWRTPAGLRVAEDRCPHLGARWSEGRLQGDSLVCPWHGLRLSPSDAACSRYACHDDGVLLWVRLPGEASTSRPVLPERPSRALASVMTIEGRCTPLEVLENRLDPWHGAHFHRHSFARLGLLAKSDDEVTVRVAYRVMGPLAVEVDARFHCPDSRTIVMTIVAGEGAGSVVETHAAPLGVGRCLVTEAVLATSDRPGFGLALRAGRLLTPWIRRRAHRLWVDDMAYCERRRALRASGRLPDAARAQCT